MFQVRMHFAKFGESPLIKQLVIRLMIVALAVFYMNPKISKDLRTRKPSTVFESLESRLELRVERLPDGLAGAFRKAPGPSDSV